MNAEIAPPRRGALHVRWFFYAAAVILIALSVMLSKSNHVTSYVTSPIWHHPAKAAALSPCPVGSELDPRCYGQPAFDTGGDSYPMYGSYYRMPWIMVGIASGLLLVGLGRIADRR